MSTLVLERRCGRGAHQRNAPAGSASDRPRGRRRRLSPDFPLGVDIEVFIRREDAVRFIEVRGDDLSSRASCVSRSGS